MQIFGQYGPTKHIPQTGYFEPSILFFVAGGAQPTRRADDDGDYEYGDDEGPKEAQWALN